VARPAESGIPYPWNARRLGVFEVSEKARSLLKELLPQRPEPEQVFRLSRQSGAFGLRFDIPSEGDVLIEHEEETILAISPELADSLVGTIDREDSAEGPRLVLVRGRGG
jgi:hypothetical protein